MLRKLNIKDKLNFFDFAIKNNIDICLFNDFVNNKKMAFIEDSKDKINGLLYIEKKDKNYLTVISNSKNVISNLLKILFWNFKKDIYAEIDQKNKIGFILKENGFRIINKNDTTFTLYYDSNKRNNRYGQRHNK